MNEAEEANDLVAKKEDEIKALKSCLGAIHKKKTEVDDMSREEQMKLIHALQEENKLLLKQNTRDNKAMELYDEEINDRDSEILDLKMKLKLGSSSPASSHDGVLDVGLVNLSEGSPKSAVSKLSPSHPHRKTKTNSTRSHVINKEKQPNKPKKSSSSHSHGLLQNPDGDGDGDWAGKNKSKSDHDYDQDNMFPIDPNGARIDKSDKSRKQFR